MIGVDAKLDFGRPPIDPRTRLEGSGHKVGRVPNRRITVDSIVCLLLLDIAAYRRFRS